MKREIPDRVSVTAGRIRKDVKQYGPGMLAAVVLYFLIHAVFDAFCPSVLISGFPCPGCGMTRAVIYLFTGQLKRSWALNPAAVFWVIWAFWSAFERYGRGRRSKASFQAACGILLFMIIVYIVRMKMYFPDRPPYVYTKDNLFSEIIPGYDRIADYLAEILRPGR